MNRDDVPTARATVTPSDVKQARAVLSAPDISDDDHAAALLVLARAAYYRNRVDEAVRLLGEARVRAREESTLTEILLELAPALSKLGRPDEALAILADTDAVVDGARLGQLRNLRGVILADLGRFPEAVAEMEQAFELFDRAGDAERSARSLVNLAAAASEMGALDDAERWYGQARERAVATGQHDVAAAIEGNLGYLESRRGDFAAALGWFERARAGLEQLDGVELLVGVLEMDYARTLFDVGLVAESIEAAQRARRTARTGSNQMLEVQASLIEAEALLRLGDASAASAAAERASDLAAGLGRESWRLHAAYLLAEAGFDGPAAPVAMSVADIEGFLDVGWVREAHQLALRHARRTRSQAPDEAKRLLTELSERTTDLDVDPVDRHLAELIVAEIDDDPDAAGAAVDAALDAMDAQRTLFGSAELRATIRSRLEPLFGVALAAARRSDDPASSTIDLLDKMRAADHTGIVPAARTGLDVASMQRLRDARITAAETRRDGGDVAGAEAYRRELERAILLARRSAPGGGSTTGRRWPRLDEIDLGSGTAFITYAVDDDGVLLGLSLRDRRTELVELGPIADVQGAVSAQRSALRRLADERRPATQATFDRLVESSDRLDDLLVRPLGVGPIDRAVISPCAPLRDVTWTALPALQRVAVTMTTTLRGWALGHDPVVVSNVALLGGPGLRSVEAELVDIATTWGAPDAWNPEATCEDALHGIRTADLVHIAAHGEFRADNPFFSSLQLTDGPLSILEMSQLDRLASVVILASCDAAAAISPSGSGGDVVIGTASELLALGARIVVAPSVVVNDGAAAELSRQLHRLLAAGASLDDAMVQARIRFLADDDLRARSAAFAMQVMGDRSSARPFVRGSGPSRPR